MTNPGLEKDAAPAKLFRTILKHLPKLRRAAGKAVQKAAPAAAKATAKAAPKALPEAARAAEKALPKTVRLTGEAKRILPDVLEEYGLGHLRGASREAVRDALRQTPRVSKDIPRSQRRILQREINGRMSEIRKAVSSAAKSDLREVSKELSRLKLLEKGLAGAERDVVRGEIRRLGLQQRILSERLPFMQQSLGQRVGRLAKVPFTRPLSTAFTIMEGKDTVDNLRNGDYANAAYHAAMIPLVGGNLIGETGKAIRAVTRMKALNRVGRAVENIGRPFEMMEFGGQYGRRAGILSPTRYNSVLRWMQRHPYMTAEIVGTPAGASTIPNELRDLAREFRGGREQPNTAATVPGGFTPEAGEARRAQGMLSEDLKRYLSILGLAAIPAAGAAALAGGRKKRKRDDEEDA